MKKFKLQIISSCCILLPLISQASTPEAVNRTFIENYKDMVFASCVTKAYKGNKDVAKDTGSSVSALKDWIDYDIDKSIDKEIILIDSYLSRNYFNPVAEQEVKGIKFDFLKCLDLYHSKELDKLARKVISNLNEKVTKD
ncbi:type VI secretion system amidase immunity protein Tai4 [Snodgrassella sp. B3088]|uniref:type VI secretion system amidase immunity protein Tai4 n=1 Tax=unclassified Snodgrassella TaxID=2625236 RepID=UPI00226AB256|nr:MULTISPECIES: type VI secretion system amidase immunity protein Tai4 [unclassified Snodgrassella]MCX8748195.1 type VI secretion system amidase immunity protein Tai4 [Snodgrassella sp. B3088]MCX8752763.1 type VI secretion system amidase immunity protein Tai4 [Snodgrassella sp. B3837]